MTDTRPRWFLDVDGTLAPLDRASLAEAVGPRHAFLYPGQVSSLLRVPYDPTLIARIAGLHQSGRVEVVWLTTWDTVATTAWEEVGMPRLAHAERAVGPYKFSKANAVRAWLNSNPGSRAVWTDDDMRRGGLPGFEGRFLAIRPKSEVGLTHAAVDRIEAWLRAAEEADGIAWDQALSGRPLSDEGKTALFKKTLELEEGLDG